jgi:hypothetical protein
LTNPRLPKRQFSLKDFCRTCPSTSIVTHSRQKKDQLAEILVADDIFPRQLRRRVRIFGFLWRVHAPVSFNVSSRAQSMPNIVVTVPMVRRYFANRYSMTTASIENLNQTTLFFEIVMSRWAV